mmetsp:Transcript_62185/g.109530  ORF Transcript_62185/g.109530 Transcript_62185/m.109530 type:complete len:296 (+) Transcript_62185:390-1277(+)
MRGGQVASKNNLGPLDLEFVSHIGIVGLIHGDGEVRISTGLSVHRGELAGDGGDAGQLGGVHTDGGTHTVGLQRVGGGERFPTEILSRRTQSWALVATDTRRAESQWFSRRRFCKELFLEQRLHHIHLQRSQLISNTDRVAKRNKFNREERCAQVSRGGREERQQVLLRGFQSNLLGWGCHFQALLYSQNNREHQGWVAREMGVDELAANLTVFAGCVAAEDVTKAFQCKAQSLLPYSFISRQTGLHRRFPEGSRKQLEPFQGRCALLRREQTTRVARPLLGLQTGGDRNRVGLG